MNGRRWLLWAWCVAGGLLAGCSEPRGGGPTGPAGQPASLPSADPVSTETAPPSAPSADPEFAKAIRSACRDVADVRQVSDGGRGAPIVLLEERHDSVAGQIQQAILLNRLYEGQGLRDIALEGYLEEDREITSDWYERAAQGLEFPRKAAVTVELLASGDINSAEFMKLLYSDVVLHRTERADTYDVKMRPEAAAAPVIYLLAIAERAIKPEHEEQLARLQREMEQLQGEAQQAKQREWVEYQIGLDPWTGDKYRELNRATQGGIIDNRKQLALLAEIRQQADQAGVEVDAETRAVMQELEQFLERRNRADVPLAQAILRTAEQSPTALVAAVIGAGHTEAVVQTLRDAGRRLVVARPTTFDSGPGGSISLDAMERKYAQTSIYSAGVMGAILDAFPPSRHKKPKPVVPEEWFKTTAELRVLAERLVRNCLDTGGNPPWRFEPADLTTPRVEIDPRLIEIVPDHPGSTKQCVLFPVRLKSPDPTKQQTLWMKATRDAALPLPARTPDRTDVEAMLVQAFEGVKPQKERAQKVEDNRSRFRLTLQTVATATNSREQTQAIALTE